MFRFVRRLKTFSSARRSASGRHRRPPTRLGVEALEDRSVPSALLTGPLSVQAVPGLGTSLAQAAAPVTPVRVLGQTPSTLVANQSSLATPSLVRELPGKDGPIQAKWLAQGAQQGPLGNPVTAERTAADGIGRFQYFEGGAIFWSPSTLAHVVTGNILATWESLGREASSLGYPTSDTPALLPAPVFNPGPLAWSQWTDFQDGAIFYTASHTEGSLPIINPISGAVIRGGSTRWVPAVTLVVDGPIGARYASLGWEKSSLGFPHSSVLPAPDSIGQYAHFEGGTIYSVNGNTYVLSGAIRDRWEKDGWAKGPLGLPLTDVKAAPDGIGRFADFQNGTMYSANGNTHVLSGAILKRWEGDGWAKGPLGYPLSDIQDMPDHIGQFADFQAGAIYTSGLTGPHVVYGPLRWSTRTRPTSGTPMTGWSSCSWACPPATNATSRGCPGRA
jgi:uncharacterized protein with LGFP repeats